MRTVTTVRRRLGRRAVARTAHNRGLAGTVTIPQDAGSVAWVLDQVAGALRTLPSVPELLIGADNAQMARHSPPRSERRLLALPQTGMNYAALGEASSAATFRCASASIAYGVRRRVRYEIPTTRTCRHRRQGQPAR